MSNDARLGLVIGVGLVITVAVVFFRKDLITRKPTPDPAAPTTIHSPRPSPLGAPRGASRPVRARTASQTDAPEVRTGEGMGDGKPEGETSEAARSRQPPGR